MRGSTSQQPAETQLEDSEPKHDMASGFTPPAARTLLLGLLLLITCLYSLLARDTYAGDFRAYYVAAQASHAGLDPYRNQVNVDERYADRDWLQVNSRFIYPPSSLFLFAPFAKLSYKTAKVVFGTGLALAMVWILMGLRDRHPRVWWLALPLFLSLPVAADVDNGQVDILILALTLPALWARKSWLGGACLGIAIAIKLSPILVLGWLLATRRWATAAWAAVVSGALTLLAARVWGVGIYREFFAHLREHLGPNPALLTHTFRDAQVLYGRFVVMGQNTYSLHYFYGTRQNPLLPLGNAAAPAGLALVLGYLAWLLVSRRGKALTAEASFYAFLVMALFANALLWPAGLVACFPLTMLLVARATRQAEWAIALLAPFFLPIEVVGNQRFLLWVVVAGCCLWRGLVSANGSTSSRPAKALELSGSQR